MNKIQKLTIDEKGKLHGGFSLQSLKDVGTVYAIADNLNCEKGAPGTGLYDYINLNCQCKTCDKGSEDGGKEPIEIINYGCLITPNP